VVGDPFRIGDTNTADDVTTEDRRWITWRRDTMRWELLGGGIGDHYQIVRGETTGAVGPSDVAFQIEGVDPHEQHSANPGSPLWVKAPSGGVTLTVGTAIWAIYRENVLTFDPGSGDVQVDWLMFEPGAVAPPQLRRFELTANKALASATATAKFLTDAGATTGSDVTLYDPEQQFSGRIAGNLYTGSPGFRGVAILRTDLGAVEPDRWEIVVMDGLAEFVVLKKYSVGFYKYVSSLSTNDQWANIAPGEVDDQITLTDPSSLFPGVVEVDQLITARLSDPDTSPPTYAAISSRAWGKRVRGTVVGNILVAASTFTIENITEVYGGVVPAEPLTVRQIFQQGYVAGQPTEAIWNQASQTWDNLPSPNLLGCHLLADAYGFIHVTASTLAGAGLTYAAGPGGCDQLTVAGSIAIDEGYCTELEDLATDKLHLNQITAAAGSVPANLDTGEQQFWAHFAGATARTDADWKTAGSYSASHLCGGLFNFQGSWEWRDFQSYSATAFQIFVNDNDDFDLKTTADYNTVGKQLLLNDADSWKWINRNPAPGADGAVTINSFDGVTLELVGDTLKVTVNYTPVTVYGTAGSSTSNEDTVDTTDCGV
jgi:hypothetical protein